MLLDKVGLNTRRASEAFHLPLVALLGQVLLEGTEWYAIFAQGTRHGSLAAVVLIMISHVLCLYKHSAQ